jgi:sarcosine oxidase
VQLAKQAYTCWSAVEDDTGERLVVRTGGLDLFPAGAAIDDADYRGAMDDARVRYDVLDAAAVKRRWPVFALDDDVVAIHQGDAGIVAAARATAALQRGAHAHGADLYGNTPVRALDVVDGGVALVTDAGVVRARHAVVACDAWTNRLLAPLGAALPLTVLREQLTYFASPRLDAFAAERFPVWIWMDDPSFYGFPRFGEAAVKAAEDCGGSGVDADTRTFEPDERMLERLDGFVHRLFARGAIGAPVSTKTCLYTLTPDRDFVLDRLPGAPQVSVALGAAHGFKFAAWFGRTLADLALDGGTATAIEPFALGRPALHAPGDRGSWLV